MLGPPMVHRVCYYDSRVPLRGPGYVATKAESPRTQGTCDVNKTQLDITLFSLGQFVDNANPNIDVSIDKPVILDQRGTNNGGGMKKQGEEDGSAAKGVSTSSSADNAMNSIDIKRLMSGIE
ncbi:hypothetical protein LguiA_005018 [Lonicera macranthoides]